MENSVLFFILRPKGKADAREQRPAVMLPGTQATTRGTEKSCEDFDQGEVSFCSEYEQKAPFCVFWIVQILLESKRIQKYNSVDLFMISSKMSCLVRMHLVTLNVFLWYSLTAGNTFSLSISVSGKWDWCGRTQWSPLAYEGNSE